MHETGWFLVVGGIFVATGIASSMFERLPCSTAMIYLAAGFALDVQVLHSSDLDRVRFALSGEGGLNDGVALPLTLAVVTASVVVHGISATPLMNRYQR